MAVLVNSRPYPFRSFQGNDPTSEDVRKEVEDSVNFLQKAIAANAAYINSLLSDTATALSDSISSVVTAYSAADEALATRLTTTEAIINDARTGLAAAHARITSDVTARATLYTAVASQVTTLTASVGNAFASITQEYIARVAADGTITASITTEVSARIAGDAALAASVVTEASARATADGFLEGKYTITVTAGNVVTGMNITSSTGSGTNISSVIFRASDFQIYNSSSGVAMFTVSGTDIKLGSTLIVNTTGSKIYIGGGTYNDSGTAFYVDSTGQFSLKDKLTWDGSNLAVTGAVYSTAGAIGGFTLSANSFASGSGANRMEINNTAGGLFVQLGSLTGGSAGMALSTAGINGKDSSANSSFILQTSGTSGFLSLFSAGSLTILADGNTGDVSASSFTGGNFSGNGASITSINASNIASGTISNSRLPTSPSFDNVSVGGAVGDVRGIKYAGGTTNYIAFYWDGSNVRAVVDGSLQGTIPNP